ncbi:MAG: anhydro-N-acetylmuramic acid kinase [Rubrivivax sp.]
MPLYIGLMSGTSLDGVDGVLVEFDPGGGGGTPRSRAHAHRAFEPPLRDALLALNQPGGVDELHRAALAANGVAAAYADVVAALCAATGIAPSGVRAIGAHGQTVRHRPGADGFGGYTSQLLNGALLAERCGIDVVCDLRSRDLAAGGQGAPLVPAFHAECFARPGLAVAVLNVGGIANLSLLPASGAVLGFDTGPGNALMDHWTQVHNGQPFDADGAWAAAGTPDAALLAELLADPYFDLAPPKSTGRDLFHARWLKQRLDRRGQGLDAQTVQATLLALTVHSSVEALLRTAPTTAVLRVAGGGAFNGALMRALAAELPGVDVASSAAEGVPPDQVEALAFAWLAHAFIEGRPGNLPSVTGARGARRLGALYPAE